MLGWATADAGRALCNLSIPSAKGLSEPSISADRSKTRIILSIRKLWFGFYCSRHTLRALILRLSLTFALAALTADSLSSEKCCDFSEENKAETQLGPRSCGPSTSCPVIEWGSYLLAKEAGEPCRAIILPDGLDLTQLLLLCKLGAFSPMVIIYCLKLLWSGSQDVAIKVVILTDKLTHKRNELKWIRQWWRLSSFHELL